MQDKNRFALKEWAIVQKALSEGRQIFLLRKGGLIEKKAGFTIEHSEFFIYPTYLHQQRKGIVPALTAEMEQMLASPPPEDQVILSHYAVVHDSLMIADLDRLRTLADHHVFNPDEIQKRFFYGKAPGVHCILLRVYHLPKPILRPVLPRYTGCRSWVDLDEELPTAGCRPVLDDAAFDEETARIAEILSRPVPSRPSH